MSSQSIENPAALDSLEDDLLCQAQQVPTVSACVASRRAGPGGFPFLRDLGLDLPDLLDLAPTELGGIRCGYLFYQKDQRPGAYPLLSAFLVAVARQGTWPEAAELTVFADVWQVDWHVASLLNERATPREIADAWLHSPGRRLLRGLDLLAHTPGFDDKRWSWQRLLKAAGPGQNEPIPQPLPRHAAWWQLHAAIPGADLAQWQPECQDPVPVLQLLEDTIPLFVRAAALLWVLNRAMDNPIYPAGGENRDLRRDMEVPLLTSLSPDLAAANIAATRMAALVPHSDAALRWQYEHSHALETYALLHAAQVAGMARMAETASDATPTARDLWRIARWLLACILRSPFLGADEETLAMRLRALLPGSLARPIPSDDILHPSRFRCDGTGLDVAEVAFLNALYVHYARQSTGRPTLDPPETITRPLYRIAARPLNDGERDAENVLVRLLRSGSNTLGSGELGWPAPYVASPMLARYLLTQLKRPWLIGVVNHDVNGDSPIFDELLNGLRDTPARYLRWLAFPFYDEGYRLSAQLLERAAQTWRDLQDATPSKDRFLLAILGAGLLKALLPGDVSALLDLAQGAPSEWRPTVLDNLAKAAEREHQGEIFMQSMTLLQAIVEAAGAPTKERIEAAHVLVRRTAVERAPFEPGARSAILAWFGRTLNAPPFIDQLGLRRALRTFGLLRA